MHSLDRGCDGPSETAPMESNFELEKLTVIFTVIIRVHKEAMLNFKAFERIPLNLYSGSGSSSSLISRKTWFRSIYLFFL